MKHFAFSFVIISAGFTSGCNDIIYKISTVSAACVFSCNMYFIFLNYKLMLFLFFCFFWGGGWGMVVKFIDWYFILYTVNVNFRVLRVSHAGKTIASEAFCSLQDSCFCASAAVHFVVTNLTIPCCPAFISYYCLILCLPKVMYCWCSLLPDIASSC